MKHRAPKIALAVVVLLVLAAAALIGYGLSERGLPFIVAVNQFEGVQQYSLDEIANALALPPEVPIIAIDARDRESAKTALLRITEYSLEKLTAQLSVGVH